MGLWVGTWLLKALCITRKRELFYLFEESAQSIFWGTSILGLGSILYSLNFVYFDFIPLLYLQFLVWTSVRDVKYIWLMILNGPSIAQVFSVLKIKIDICHWEFMMLKWHYSWSKSIPGQELYLAPRLLLSFRWKQTEGMANDLRRRIPRDLVVKVRLHRDLMYKMMRCFFNVVYLLVDC